MSTVTLNWVNPTSSANGGVITPAKISNCTIFDNGVEIGKVGSGVTNFTTAKLSPGRHEFTVAAYDTTSNAAVPVTSVVMSIPADPTQLNPISELTAILNAS